MPDYPPRIPRELPADQVLVHNHVRPSRTQGARGFRYWLRGLTEKPPIERCACGWAPHLPEHYRPRGLPPLDLALRWLHRVEEDLRDALVESDERSFPAALRAILQDTLDNVQASVKEVERIRGDSEDAN